MMEKKNLVDVEKVGSAVEILKDINKKHANKNLLNDDEDAPVFLTFSLKKIPSKKFRTNIKIKLPQSLHKAKADVCLIAGDLDKRDLKGDVQADVRKIKELLKEKHVTRISEVLTLRQLRTEYKEYFLKGRLVQAHDVFLCDKKIAQCLPRILGKFFHEKNKFPLQVDMKSSNLKAEVDKKLCMINFPLSCRGNSCSGRVATLGMESSDITKNILKSISVLREKVPGGCANIEGIYLKLMKSAAIPIYVSHEDASNVRLSRSRPKPQPVVGELSTVDDKVVFVYKDGRVKEINEKEYEARKAELKLKRAEKAAKKMEMFSNKGALKGKRKKVGDEGVISDDVQENESNFKDKVKRARKDNVKKSKNDIPKSDVKKKDSEDEDDIKVSVIDKMIEIDDDEESEGDEESDDDVDESAVEDDTNGSDAEDDESVSEDESS